MYFQLHSMFTGCEMQIEQEKEEKKFVGNRKYTRDVHVCTISVVFLLFVPCAMHNNNLPSVGITRGNSILQ